MQGIKTMTLKFLLYNVRGLNSPVKRFNIIREIKHLKAEVIFLQETHSNSKIFSKDYPIWYYGDSSTKWAKGVTIGFARGVRFTPEERLADPEGCYLFLRGRINEVEYSLANLYCPNKNPIRYLKGVIEKFMEFKKGGAIMSGDFNLCMDPTIDSMSRVQWTGNVQRNTLIKKLHQYQLIDIWRIQHPKIRDYTFHCIRDILKNLFFFFWSNIGCWRQ